MPKCAASSWPPLFSFMEIPVHSRWLAPSANVFCHLVLFSPAFVMYPPQQFTKATQQGIRKRNNARLLTGPLLLLRLSATFVTIIDPVPVSTDSAAPCTINSYFDELSIKADKIYWKLTLAQQVRRYACGSIVSENIRAEKLQHNTIWQIIRPISVDCSKKDKTQRKK